MRLIDANLAMRKIREYMEDYPNATARLAACRACLSILGDKQQVPTIDPESLRPRGTWEDGPEIKVFKEEKIPTVQCPKCLLYFGDLINNHREVYRFCPYCGAKMEGGYNP